MTKIKCPHCGQEFDLSGDESAEILAQVKNHELAEEVAAREKVLMATKEKEIAELKNTANAHAAKLNLAHEKELAEIKSKLAAAETAKKLAVTEAIADEKDRAAELEKARANEIAKIEKERDAALNELKNKDTAVELELKSQKEQYEEKLNSEKLRREDLMDEIERLKDMKLKLSTKMIGESLEQFCYNEFNKIRMTAFPRAHFEKDNDVSRASGSKGDFIYRDFADDGTEYISIMFEMKNENDATATKHKNADFLKELNKDRREKNCEYAVLVTMLEPDNEFYNTGIVQSWEYEKMYIIRPQFFIQFITILRSAALNSLSYKKQLAVVKNQNLDFTNFENNLAAFQAAFGKNYELAGRRFQEAIESIDKTIKDLEKTKAALISSDRNLRLANDKAQDLTIKRLTKNAPSVAEKFAKS
jgi:hypothetical protein